MNNQQLIFIMWIILSTLLMTVVFLAAAIELIKVFGYGSMVVIGIWGVATLFLTGKLSWNKK
jgi:hypothetical protein